MAQEFRINNTKIKTPKPGDFSIERYNLTKSSRLANGFMMIELIAKKRKFLFRYPVISGPELNNILSLIDGTDMGFTFSYWENNTLKYAHCYAGHIPSQLWRRDGPWVWRDVNFDIIER